MCLLHNLKEKEKKKKKTLQMCGTKLTKVTVIPPVLPLKLVFHGFNFYTATHPRTSKRGFLDTQWTQGRARLPGINLPKYKGQDPST